MQTHDLYINGVFKAGSGEHIKSLNPSTGEVLLEVKGANKESVNLAVCAAHEAFGAWSRLKLERRIDYLKEFEEKLIDQIEEFAKLISQETGKPLWEALTEAGAMIKKIDVSIKAFRDRCGETEGELAGAKTATRFKPHGVVAVFGPFNLPGHLPNGHIVPALLAGNTVVFKPSELTPLVGQRMVELWDEVGLPKGVLNLVQGAKETGVILSTHSDINGLFFTGSAKVGVEIHKAFAGHPEKILALEMGGNNPLVVFDIKDKEAASYLTIQSAFITSGQRCVCARRLIVPKGDEGDLFINVLLTMIEKIKIGLPGDEPEPFMGPLISKEAAGHVLNAQEKLVKKGAEVLLKSELNARSEALISCGVIDVTDIKSREDEEIFGPLLQVIRVKDFDEAIKEANNTKYGLSAGLLSDNQEYYEKFLKHIRAGVVNWNRQITGASSAAPFGGVGLSGNFNPSAYFAADYCSYPVASIESNDLSMPESKTPGIDV